MINSQQNATSTPLVCRLGDNFRVKLIGLGGIGCIVLQYLGMFLKASGRSVRLVLIDGDSYLPRDFQRMSFQTLGNKAEVKVQETADALQADNLTLVPVPEFVTSENLHRLIVPRDHVFLCVDNHATRRLVSDHCSTLSEVALFSGGNDGVEPPNQRGTYGNVQIAIRRGGRDLTVPITRYHPEIANAEGGLPGGPDCGQLAVSVPQILFANLAVASALLNSFFAYTCGRLAYQEVQLDILDARMLPQLPLAPKDAPSPLLSSD
jgi:hypothetical protein